jgi:hypothetical protein
MKKVIRAVLFCSLSVVAFAAADLEERISTLESKADLLEISNRLSLGGYGEIHATSKDGANYLDYHRVVLYAGYQFNDWIRLNSEIELEHAKAGKGSKDNQVVGDSGNDAAQGYVLLEQFSVDLQVTESTAIRLGRTLAPLGIVGPRHEPPLFFGVERPEVEKYILPSTWSIDGVGLVGDISSDISYEVYAVGGLDGSSFSLGNGIRDGREASYPGIEKPSVTGRMDYYGIDGLRVGAAFYQGSTEFGEKGDNDGSDDSEVSIASLDFEYQAGGLYLNGLWAAGSHDGNDSIDAQDFGGNYVTAGYTIWSQGEKAVIPFVRLSSYDTAENLDGYKRSQIQYGVHVPLSNQFCLKADYIDAGDSDSNYQSDVFSVGVGMMFQ